MSISGGIGRGIRHPIAGNLFADPDTVAFTMGNDRNTFFQGPDGKFAFTRASTGTFLGSNGFIQTAATDVFRFDYDPLDQTTLSSGGWLAERDKTNFLIRSEELNNAGAWTRTGCTITPDTDTAPDGATTMDTIREDSSTGAHGVEMTSAAFASGFRITASCWADAINRSFLKIEVELISGVQEAWFDLAAGTVGTTSGVDLDAVGIIGPYRNGRFRCFLQTDAAGGETTAIARFEAADADGSSSYTGTTQDSILCWGCQLEQDSMGSYIPTAAAAVTRAQDFPAVSLDDIPPNHIDMYMEMNLLVVPNIDAQIQTFITTSIGANGEAISVAKIATNELAINISDDTGALRFTNFAFNTGDYAPLVTIHVNWDNARVGEDRVRMTENGGNMAFVSEAQPGTSHWTDMPGELRFWDTARETSIKIRSLVFNP